MEVPVPPLDPRPLVHRVIARLNVGGPAMHVVHLQRGLAERGYRTRLIVGEISPGEGDMEYYARERGVELTRIPHLGRETHPIRDLRTLLALVALFRRERPQIVHTHTAKAGALGRMAATLAGVPVRIHTFHGHVLGGGYFSPARTRFYVELERILARLTQRIVVLTPGQLQELAGTFAVAPARAFQVIPLGLELQRFADSRPQAEAARFRAELGLGPAERLVGIVGRLAPVKNHQLLLRALPLLPPSVHLAVVGGGESEVALRTLAQGLGIASRVHWLGWRTDLTPVYPALDALALVSLDEGTPVAILEALAAGVPVAARPVGGVPEILGHGERGALIPEATPHAVARTIGGLLEAPPGSEVLERARHYALSSFGVERLVEEVDALYRKEWRRVTGSAFG